MTPQQIKSWSHGAIVFGDTKFAKREKDAKGNVIETNEDGKRFLLKLIKRHDVDHAQYQLVEQL